MRFYRLLFEFVVFVVYGACMVYWYFGSAGIAVRGDLWNAKHVIFWYKRCLFFCVTCFMLFVVLPLLFYRCCFTVVVFENVVYGTWRTP